MLSATTLADSLDRRLRTAGRIVPEMQVRLFDGDRDVTESGRGQPACRGPALSLGYLGGTDHDKLFTKDGWMRMGDICELDADGYLTLTGRTSDFILRGGKNISAVQVEEAVATHPAVAVAAAGRDARPGLRRAGLRVRRAQARLRTRPARPRRTPAAAGRLQGAAARATRSPRRAAAIVGRQDRQRPTSRTNSIDTWSGHDHRRSTARRPGGMGAIEGAAHRSRPHRRTTDGDRLPAPRRHRFRREHGRAHHLAARRPVRHVRQPVGPVVAGADRIRHLRRRRGRAGGPRALGRHARHPHPHRTAPASGPTPGW